MTVPREAGLAKNWARDAGFMFARLLGMSETVGCEKCARGVITYQFLSR